MSPKLAKEGRKIVSAVGAKVVDDLIQERDQVVRRTTGPINKKDDPIEWLVRIAAAGIGFVSEAHQYRREKKKKREGENEVEIHRLLPQPEDATLIDGVIQEPNPLETDPDSQPPKDHSNDLAKAFLKRHPTKPSMNPTMKLSAPVILRQRRPKTRARGFIRAYAPVLDDVGIDQETFFDFIDTFNEALEPNPWLYSFNLAGLAGLAVPEPLMMLLGVGVGIATDAAIETQSRFKSNKFLDSINAEFFVPRGLLCLVVTWKPEAADGELITTVDLEGKSVESQTKATTSFNQKIKDIITKTSSREKELQKFQGQIQDRMKSSSGAFEWPEPAPLIFPSPEDADSAQHRAVVGNKKKKNALDRAERWLDEYMDKCTQAKWLEKNRDHPTASFSPKPEFRSRYADPSHPAASGDPVAFLTGGKWQSGREKTVENRPLGPDRNGKDQKLGSASLKAKSSSSGSAPSGRFIDLLQRDVLYLLIVDVTPSRIDGFEGSGDRAVA